MRTHCYTSDIEIIASHTNFSPQHRRVKLVRFYISGKRAPQTREKLGHKSFRRYDVHILTYVYVQMYSYYINILMNIYNTNISAEIGFTSTATNGFRDLGVA